MKAPTNDNSDHSGGKFYDDYYNNDMPNGNTHSKENGKFLVSDRKKHPYDHNASEILGGRAKRFKELEDQQTNPVIRRTFLQEKIHKVNIERNGFKAATMSMVSIFPFDCMVGYALISRRCNSFLELAVMF